MNLLTRLIVVGFIVGGVTAAVTFLSSGTNAAAPEMQRWESSKQCRDCHQALYDEWEGSHHQISFTNPEVRELSDEFRKEECLDCHLPRPLAVTGFGKRTLPRRTHFDEGISCITCHLAPDGGILGRNARPDVPCRPQASTELLQVDTCASCHNQHGTTDQWQASHYADNGTDCSDCHMQQVERKRADGSTYLGRRHVFPGAHDKAFLQTAAKFTVQRQDDKVTLALENTGAGHNFPTEERHRAVDMMYRFVTEDGPAAEWTQAWRFRQPYRDEPGENTQLPAGTTKSIAVEVPAGAIAIEARLWYRLTPFVLDDDPMSTLLEERRLEL